MTSPEVESLGAKHLRTAVGLVCMVSAAGFVFYDQLLAGRNHEACPSTWAAVIGEYGFPLMVFAAGILLFSKGAFLDLISAGKALIPGRGPS